MRKTFFTMCLMAVAMFSMQSCKSSKVVATPSVDLAGEWEIIEIYGSSVVPAEHQPFPFIGFNLSEARFYGSSGCNRMMGEVNLGEKANALSFGKIAGTMMMCPNMDIEQSVLRMLENVKSYKGISETEIELLGSKKNPIAILKMKDNAIVDENLTSKWQVNSFADKDKDLLLAKGNAPYIDIDVEAKSVTGFAGCNRINGVANFGAGELQSVSFSKMAVTRMMCENIAVETAFLKVLNEAATYKISNDHSELVLYDKEGRRIIEFMNVGE